MDTTKILFIRHCHVDFDAYEIKGKYVDLSPKGWGLEDTFFGATAIAEGYFIIPILNTGVYHIDHSPRSVSHKEMIDEYEKNIEVYKKLIHKKI